MLNLGIGDDVADEAALSDEQEDHNGCVDCNKRVDGAVEVVADKEGVDNAFDYFKTDFPRFVVDTRPDTDDESFRFCPVKSLKLELTWRGTVYFAVLIAFVSSPNLILL